MKVLNIHKRIINQSKQEVYKLLDSLSTKDDKIWPYEKWPAIRFKSGLKMGSKGGHGPIRYTVVSANYTDGIVFKFINKGFNGTHEFKINELNNSKVEIIHIIKMKTSGVVTYYWLFIIRWLHDALIEDAFDKLENQFSAEKKEITYNFWVKFLRMIKYKKSKKLHKRYLIEER
ncbi:hypothetical protein [Flavivirga spongiicola]|uniref:SRPBCC family protein n=1 Tax=Flavivirga spongiicola TaxID=421621 RepID=A0ABU7XM52_9FLAO|nr:hypothetical protein [Flavivirga sp. MEBiC05379]MDO5981315.1 hypothetical protein [Flavivirga sp. MEBiC05379]